MKIGDLVTYKQREDLQAFPCPWHRMGIIITEDGNAKAVPCLPRTTPRVIFEVYWYDSGNVVSHLEKGLETLNENR
jgi:hypothetical protein